MVKYFCRLLLIFTAPLAAAQLEYCLSTNYTDAPPFVLGKAGNYDDGILLAPVLAVLNASGLDYQVKVFPQKRCLARLRSGKSAFFVGVETPLRLTQAKFVEVPMFYIEQKVFVLSKQIIQLSQQQQIVRSWQDTLDLDWRYGQKRGYQYFISPAQRAAVAKNKVTLVSLSTSEALAKMLIKGRIDAVIVGDVSFKQTIAKLKAQELITTLAENFNTVAMQLMVANQHVAHHEHLSQIARSLACSGELHSIAQRWQQSYSPHFSKRFSCSEQAVER